MQWKHLLDTCLTINFPFMSSISFWCLPAHILFPYVPFNVLPLQSVLLCGRMIWWFLPCLTFAFFILPSTRSTPSLSIIGLTSLSFFWEISWMFFSCDIWSPSDSSSSTTCQKGNIISVFVSPTRWVLALISEFYSDNWTTKLIWCSPSCLLFYRNVGPLIQSLFSFRSYIADTLILLQRSAGLLFPITWYHWSVFVSSRISDTLFATYFEAMIFIFYILNITFRHWIHRHTHDTRDVLDGALWVIAWQFLVVGIRWY